MFPAFPSDLSLRYQLQDFFENTAELPFRPFWRAGAFVFQLTVFTLISMTVATGAVAAPNVVTSIRPLLSIAQAVMKGVGTPDLLLEGRASPHHASLKPSHARKLASADLIVWVGPSVETFLTNALNGKDTVLTLLEETKEGKDEKEEHHEHDGDAHLWLDPASAVDAAGKLERGLAKLDPPNAAQYRANLQAFTDRVGRWEAETMEMLKAVKDKPYIVFHDAYGAFSNHFGLRKGYALSPGEMSRPGAARIKELQGLMDRENIGCIIQEQDSDMKLLAALVGNRVVNHVVIDPLGPIGLTGDGQYFQMMNDVRDAFIRCLSK